MLTTYELLWYALNSVILRVDSVEKSTELLLDYPLAVIDVQYQFSETHEGREDADRCLDGECW